MAAAGKNCCLGKGLSPAEFCPSIEVTEKIANFSIHSLHSAFDMLTKKIEYLLVYRIITRIY